MRGGDGLAFVVQRDFNTTAALGADGGQMGFGGLMNSVAVAFDIWQNPGDDKFGVDHISVQSRGPTLANDALDAGILGIPRATPLADGEIHRIRITYFQELKAEYLQYLVASDSLVPYLLDNGEQKRIGTLVVYVDKGIDTNTPILAMPINLSLLLDLPTDKAFVGFTSATGRFFAKHDLLSWTFCDEEPCQTGHATDFDYHQNDKLFPGAKTSLNDQGPGYGGGDNEQFPSRHASPDTTPWEEPLKHFALGRQHGLSDIGAEQVPPATLY